MQTLVVTRGWSSKDFTYWSRLKLSLLKSTKLFILIHVWVFSFLVKNHLLKLFFRTFLNWSFQNSSKKHLQMCLCSEMPITIKESWAMCSEGYPLLTGSTTTEQLPWSCLSTKDSRGIFHWQRKNLLNSLKRCLKTQDNKLFNLQNLLLLLPTWSRHPLPMKLLKVRRSMMMPSITVTEYWTNVPLKAKLKEEQKDLLNSERTPMMITGGKFYNSMTRPTLQRQFTRVWKRNMSSTVKEYKLVQCKWFNQNSTLTLRWMIWVIILLLM